jgi:hypothetical protein
MELSNFSHGGLLSNFTEFLEPGFETVGLGEGSTNNVGVRLVKHCHTWNVHVRIWVDRGWVVIVVVCADRDMHGAILVGPSEYNLLLKLTFVMQGGSGIRIEQWRPSTVVDPRQCLQFWLLLCH